MTEEGGRSCVICGEDEVVFQRMASELSIRIQDAASRGAPESAFGEAPLASISLFPEASE